MRSDAYEREGDRCKHAKRKDQNSKAEEVLAKGDSLSIARNGVDFSLFRLDTNYVSCWRAVLSAEGVVGVERV